MNVVTVATLCSSQPAECFFIYYLAIFLTNSCIICLRWTVKLTSLDREAGDTILLFVLIIWAVVLVISESHIPERPRRKKTSTKNLVMYTNIYIIISLFTVLKLLNYYIFIRIVFNLNSQNF